MDVPRAHSPVTAGVEGRGARVLSVRDRCRRSEESALIEQEVQDGRGRSSTGKAERRREAPQRRGFWDVRVVLLLCAAR